MINRYFNSKMLPNDIINEIITHCEMTTLLDFCYTCKTIFNIGKKNLNFKIFNNHIRYIGCGNNFTFIISNNKLYSFGENSYGQLGLGNNQNYDSHQLVDLKDPISVSCGNNFTIVLTKHGVYGCGSCNHGQLGLDINKRNCNTFQKIPINNIIAFVCGGYHTIILTKHGLYGCGDNFEGQLGVGHYNDCNIPMKINISDVLNIHCGDVFTIILTKYNIYGFGDNTFSQILNCIKKCSLPTIINVNINVKKIIVGSYQTYFISSGSNHYGNLIPSDTQVVNLLTLINIDNVTHISSASYFTIFVKDNKIYKCGDRISKKFLVPTLIDSINEKIIDIISGANHTIIQCIKDNQYIFYGLDKNNFKSLQLIKIH